MTNIKEIEEIKNLRTHINEAYEYLDCYLPNRYSKEVQKRLKEKETKVSITTITNVRNRTNGNERLDVLNALLEVAEQNKAYLDRIVKIVNPR